MKRPNFKWTRWSWLWVIWLAAFLAIELPAVFNSTENDTLSEHIWALTEISLFYWLVGGFLVWLLVHMLGPKTRKWLNTWRK